MKSSTSPLADDAFYVASTPATAGSSPGAENGAEHFLSSPATGSPWGPTSQHGGPPAALLMRTLEGLDSGRTPARFTMELLGPVPLGPVSVTARVTRPGRTVDLREATLHDDERGRPVASARAWFLPASGDGPRSPGPGPEHRPEDGGDRHPPSSWNHGYMDAVEWRWITGAITEAGPGVVWMRPRVPLVRGEPMSPVQRVVTCADSASGVSAELDPDRWGFLNTELTVHVLRPPEGEWLCLDATTTLSSGLAGVATSIVYDARGQVARSAQALLVAPR